MLAAHHEKQKTRNEGMSTLDVEMTVSGSREMSRNGSSKYMKSLKEEHMSTFNPNHVK